MARPAAKVRYMLPRTPTSNMPPNLFAAPSSGKATQDTFIDFNRSIISGIVVCKEAMEFPWR